MPMTKLEIKRVIKVGWMNEVIVMDVDGGMSR